MEEQNTVEYLYVQELMPIAHIAEMLRISESTVRKRLKQSGIELRGNLKKIPEADLRRWYIDEGLSQAEIAKRCGRSIPTVQKYIADYGMQRTREQIVDCYKKTNIARYGVENTFQAEEKKEKIKKTNLARYGVENVSVLDSVKQRKRETTKSHYGVEYPNQSDEIKNRIRQRNLEKYGVEHVFQADDVKDSIKKTNIARYGVENVFQSEEKKDKIRNTYRHRYGNGVSHPSQIPGMQERITQTNIERYGIPRPCVAAGQAHIEHLDEWNVLSEYVMKRYNELGRKLSRSETAAYFNIGYKTLCAAIKENNLYSMFSTSLTVPEQAWTSWLDSLGIEYRTHDRQVLNGHEIDIFIPSSNLGLEINPTASHNSTLNVFGGEPTARLYHQRKSTAGDKAGVNVVHVFDWYDTEKARSFIKSLLGLNRRIFARCTKVGIVERSEEKHFENANHLHGYVKSSKCYGLYTKDSDELVAVMSFAHPRYGGKDGCEWELLRFCSLSGVTVVGGASKLLSAFIKDANPDSIMSFCDYSISNGNMYGKLGFAYERMTDPSYRWVNLENTEESYSWQLITSKGFDNVFGTDYGKGTSNVKLMEEAGFVKVYNAGNKVYTWHSPA